MLTTIMFHQLRGLSRARIKSDIDELLEAFRLTNHKHDQVVTLSGGTKKKLSILLALIGGSKVNDFFFSSSGFSHHLGLPEWLLMSSCPVRPPPLTPNVPYSLYTSLSTWFLSYSMSLSCYWCILLSTRRT